MRKTTYFCDKCGRQVTDTIFQIGFRTIDVLTGEQIEEEFNAEFCLDCYKEVDDAVAVAVRTRHRNRKREPLRTVRSWICRRFTRCWMPGGVMTRSVSSSGSAVRRSRTG